MYTAVTLAPRKLSQRDPCPKANASNASRPCLGGRQYLGTDDINLPKSAPECWGMYVCPHWWVDYLQNKLLASTYFPFLLA